ncbi:ferredoxin [Streptomyces sp. NBC_01320]|uniref:ferredoxin n=1 Tax=Streptomyces sp. NBC_01320 TaxID=2903824 RepID=UPI002E160ABF|nr:ferredoxin [Streptomyces sp. NBC_01320]
MRALVNQGLCSGHAQCAVAAPDLFLLDDEGYALPVDGDLPPDQESHARAGARACPERAITILEADLGSGTG